MRRFWDERAREDALYFVDNRIGYRDPAAEERFWKGGHEVVDAVLAALELEIRPDDRVVEIGCGVGRLTRVLAERAASVVALDVSTEMLDRARIANPALENVEWVLGDGESLTGVEDARADLVFSHVVFQHIPDPEVTLGYVREMGRVLRPGGRAGFHVANNPAEPLRNRQQSVRDRLRALAGRGPRGLSDPAWLGSAVDLDALRAAAREGGMAVERVVGEGTQFCLVRTRRPPGTG